MTVNGIDIRTFNAKQLTADPQPPHVSVEYYWEEKQKQPREKKTEQKAGKNTLEVYFRGDSRDKVIRMISEFLLLFDQKVEIELDGYKGTYVGFMTNRKVTKTRVPNKYKVTIELDGYFMDDPIRVELKETTELYVTGTREAPCVLTLQNRTGETKTVTITGVTEDQITASVEAGKTMEINGVDGTVLVDGGNAFDDVEMWEFPFLKPQKTIILYEGEGVKATLMYRPMWL